MTRQSLSRGWAGRWVVRAASVALGLAVALAVPGARAADTVRLKNGQTITGTIVREEGGFVWIKTVANGVEDTKLLSSTDIDKIDRDSAGGDQPATPDPVPDAAPAGGEAQS